MKIKSALILLLPIVLSAVSATAQDSPSFELAKPSAKQIAFADWEVGAFIHFDLNTFTGQEHGDGQESPSQFNPTELDAEQWVLTAKSLGAKYACLTVRHEGGFCLWPSKTTDYTIANSPYKEGKGDVVREFVEACRKHDMVPAFYHTAAFDANATLKDYKGKLDLPLDWMTTWGKAMSSAHKNDPGLKERLKKIQVEQMRELLTEYGPIGFMWSDHWNAQDPNGVWRAVTDLAEELQPEMVFMGTDTWVPGNETGHVVYPMWNAVNTVDGTNYSRPAPTKNDITDKKNDYGLLETDVLTGHPLGKFWRVRECTTNSGFHYGGWFWHPDSVKATFPKKLWEHLDLYYRTVGLGANTIINLPPDDRGLIPEDFVTAAKVFGDEIKERFSNPIAQTNKIHKGDTLELSWAKPKVINTIVTMENIANGQKVAKYVLEAFVDKKWQELKPRNKLIGFKPYNNSPRYQTIGHKKIDRVEPVTTNRIRFRSLESIVHPVEIRQMSVFNCPPVVKNFDSKFPFLSGLESTSESAHNGVKRDKNYIGENIVINGKAFQKGLMVCPVGKTSEGHIEFNISQYQDVKGITATIGIDDMVNHNGSVVFIVRTYQNGLWTDLYTSETLTGNDDGVDIDIDFPHPTSKVRLITTDGGDNANSDHAVWGNIQFKLEE
ncbi:alpha-L-fucosidase [Zobellia galactanivorans]|uniref:alpha-L-fucosidase n=1 Tax=Zobellia galactanivorans (strain DSM 12802 / CCUG 47099 / CIP 106680 / NCIMB 13871 / Dsij) TaxID=63186 RepID=UPI0026E29DAA|nr:alpha-L-fucosidase [Zobellia galactanivorans]MDO6809829.1 alpha-L-fucosidase [Zobellia galactanivorans]